MKPHRKQTLWLLAYLLVACTSPTPTPYSPTAAILLAATPTNTPAATKNSEISSARMENPTLTPSKTPTITPPPIHPTGRIVTHKGDETQPYTWFSYVPKGIKGSTVFIWVSTSTTMPTDDYTEVTIRLRNYAERLTQLADIHNLVLIVPAIPRPQTNHVYAISYDWKSFLETSDPFVQRPDIKLNIMIDQLIKVLRLDGHIVSDKVFVEGYSAGGMFAQRYTLLHPERVKAMAAGQCGGSITLPESQYSGTPLYWPSGIFDFPSLAGYEFNKDEYDKVPQFIYVGDQDDKNSTLWGTGELWRSWDQIHFLNFVFGNTDPIRLKNQVEYLNSIGYENFTFKMYPGVGHTNIPQMKEDVFAFFERFRE